MSCVTKDSRGDKTSWRVRRADQTSTGCFPSWEAAADYLEKSGEPMDAAVYTKRLETLSKLASVAESEPAESRPPLPSPAEPPVPPLVGPPSGRDSEGRVEGESNPKQARIVSSHAFSDASGSRLGSSACASESNTVYIEARKKVEDMLGVRQVEVALACLPALEGLLRNGADATSRAQTAANLFFQRCEGAWSLQTLQVSQSDGMSSYVPEGALRVYGEVEKVPGHGDCLFEALSCAKLKNDVRQRLVAWMRSHPTAVISIPCVGEVLKDSVKNHARGAYPSLDFEEYCDFMQLPWCDGGNWGEYLELAVFVKLSGISVKVYVPETSRGPGIFSEIGNIQGRRTELPTKHILWTGYHFDKLCQVKPCRDPRDDVPVEDAVGRDSIVENPFWLTATALEADAPMPVPGQLPAAEDAVDRDRIVENPLLLTATALEADAPMSDIG